MRLSRRRVGSSGDAEDFLELTQAERDLVELRLAVSRAVLAAKRGRLTQKQAAERLNTSQPRFAKIEAGARWRVARPDVPQPLFASADRSRTSGRRTAENDNSPPWSRKAEARRRFRSGHRTEERAMSGKPDIETALNESVTCNRSSSRYRALWNRQIQPRATAQRSRPGLIHRRLPQKSA